MTSELTFGQQKGRNLVMRSFLQDKSAQIIVGARGGKTTMARSLAQELIKVTPVWWVDRDKVACEKNLEGIPSIDNTVEFPWPLSDRVAYTSFRTVLSFLEACPIDQNEGVFIFHDYGWFEEGKEAYEKLRKHTSRILLISEGHAPHTVDLPKEDGITIRAATWDWNPHVKFADFERAYHTRPTEHVLRDYNVQDAWDSPFKDAVLALQGKQVS